MRETCSSIKTFTDAIIVKNISLALTKDPIVLKGGDLTEFKSCAGVLQFLANNTRVDLAAGTPHTSVRLHHS